MFDFVKYQQDAIASKEAPLERQLLPGFSQVGIDIEVFALPGFEIDPKRYLLNLRNTALAVKRNPQSLSSFLDSMKGKRILKERFDCPVLELLEFKSTAFNDRFTGVPGFLATAYWYEQAKNGNELANDIIWTLVQSKLDDLASDAFKIERTIEQRITNFVDTWETIRLRTRAGYKTLRRLVHGYYIDKVINKYNRRFAVDLNALIAGQTEQKLQDLCAEMVCTLCDLNPIDIHKQLQLEDVPSNREELRNWYSQELLDEIDQVQKALIAAIQIKPCLIEEDSAITNLFQSFKPVTPINWRKAD